MRALIILALFCLCLSKNPSNYFSMSSSFSSFSSSSNEGGKPETHFKSMNMEEYRDKQGDKPDQVRKYGEIFSKDNEGPGLLKKKANTNVEEEGLILGNNAEETKVFEDPKEEKEFLKDFGFGNLPFNHNDPFFDNFFDKSKIEENLHKMNHGKYDKFLEKRKKDLISSTDKK
jgi:hypothetical protein